MGVLVDPISIRALVPLGNTRACSGSSDLVLKDDAIVLRMKFCHIHTHMRHSRAWESDTDPKCCDFDCLRGLLVMYIRE